MLIKHEILQQIRSGAITLQFRRWTRRTVKAGGTLKTRVGVLRIGAITRVAAVDVTDTEARYAGFRDAADFRTWLDTMKPGVLDRIEVSFLGEDPRIALRQDGELAEAELAEIAQALDAMDARSATGPWTALAMDLIARDPGRPAEALARDAGGEKLPFKTRIRKLKALGLTESLDVGYCLSPRGQAVLAYRRRE